MIFPIVQQLLWHFALMELIAVRSPQISAPMISFVKNKQAAVVCPAAAAWLLQQSSHQTRYQIFSKPIDTLLQPVRPEQRYVVTSLLEVLDLNARQSLRNAVEAIATNSDSKLSKAERRTYLTRLQIELINIGMEQQIRASGNAQNIATLDRLLKCESGSSHHLRPLKT